jgi:hypothetical protein
MVDVYIIPTIEASITTQAVNAAAAQLNSSSVEGWPSTVYFNDMRRRILLPPEPLAAECRYGLELGFPNTLAVSVIENRTFCNDCFDGGLDEVAALESVRVQPSKVLELSELWRRVDRTYTLSSTGGRGPFEPAIFTRLAAVLAHVVRGYVLVKEPGQFTVRPGAYEASEFARVRPRRW